MKNRPSLLTRRELLVAGGTSAALLGCGPSAPSANGPSPIDAQQFDGATPVAFAPDALAEDTGRFSLGVQAGAMREHSALLWGYAASGGTLKLRVWRDSDVAGEVQLVHDLDVTADADGYFKVPVEGLAPATWYRYGFFSEDLSARSALGKFRTAFPEDWRAPLTLGATACTHFRFQPYRAMERLAQEPLDAMLHLGDFSYNDDAHFLPDFRARWRQTLQDPGYRALLSSTGLYVTWDDHETSNDFNPEQLAQTDPQRLATARQAFFETVATEGRADGKLWGSYRWGRTAEVFVLDCRSERRPSTRETPDAQYISPEQLAWMQQALLDSPCHFKVVMTSVPITSMPAPLWAAVGDRWQGYAAQREKLLRFIDGANLRNVWFVSGDFHMALVMRIEADGRRRRMWEIATVGGNGNNPLGVLLDADPENREAAFPARQFAYASGDYAATTLTFDPADDSVRVRFLDPVTGAARFDQVLRQTG